MAKRKHRASWLRRHAKLVAGIYIALVAASQVSQVFWPNVVIPKVDREEVKLDGKRLAYLEWGGSNPKLDPLILLHGSPSSGAAGFEVLATELSSDGRRVIAIDRWGYGGSEEWVDDYSYEAQAKAVLGLMDELGIRTAHVGGWSYGGAPALELAFQEPGRIRSVTMIAAIADQKSEGSGNYYVEHAKYGALYALVMGLPELIPHFGLLGPRHVRYAFARDFMDLDQRPLGRTLQNVRAPVLILHGKHDPMIPAWAAVKHHEMKTPSRLVMLDSSHFFPLAKKSESFGVASEEMKNFMANAEAGKSAELQGVRNETSRKNFKALWDGGPSWRGPKNLWALLVVGAIFGFFTPRLGAVLGGIAGGLWIADLVTVLACVAIGAMIRKGESTRPLKAIMVAVWGFAASIPAVLLLPFF